MRLNPELRARINRAAHAAAQRHEAEVRAKLMAEVQALRESGVGHDELLQHLDRARRDNGGAAVNGTDGLERPRARRHDPLPDHRLRCDRARQTPPVKPQMPRAREGGSNLYGLASRKPHVGTRTEFFSHFRSDRKSR